MIWEHGDSVVVVVEVEEVVVGLAEAAEVAFPEEGEVAPVRQSTDRPL